mmetsp:Transcript_25399/g.52800  ORF Transcript_25399/g.52800 Transcript_25399/m.52800 type:complete len:130 (+) Transcript_25399:188-577(+)
MPKLEVVPNAAAAVEEPAFPNENLSGPVGPAALGSLDDAGLAGVVEDPNRGFVSIPPIIVDDVGAADDPKRGFVSMPLLVADDFDGMAVEVREPKSMPLPPGEDEANSGVGSMPPPPVPGVEDPKSGFV